MIASEALRAQIHLAKNPNLSAHHSFLNCDFLALQYWAEQFDLPIFVTDEGAQATYITKYLGRQITITLKAKA